MSNRPMKFLCLVVCVLGLVACGPVTPVAPIQMNTLTPTATPVPTILPSPDVSFLGPVNIEFVNEYGLLWTFDVYALNKDEVFLFGSVSDSTGSSAQSMLLKSSDGGKYWVEVMQPVKGSDVIDFQMLESGEGWALILWTVEGPGTALLFQTTNFGQTWVQIAEIPKPKWYAFPAKMGFIDRKHGQINVCLIGGLDDQVDFFTTSDGGVTWDKSGSYSPPFDGPLKSDAIANLCTWSEKTFNHALEYDSRWRLDRVGHNIILSRQLNSDYLWGEWLVMNRFPDRIKYENRQLIVP
jgi:hypothetical protein